MSATGPLPPRTGPLQAPPPPPPPPEEAAEHVRQHPQDADLVTRMLFDALRLTGDLSRVERP